MYSSTPYCKISGFKTIAVAHCTVHLVKTVLLVYNVVIVYVYHAICVSVQCAILNVDSLSQARKTWSNSGGVAEGQSRFDKEGVAIIFIFLCVKNNYHFLELLR